MSDSVRPHRRQPTRLPRPWDSPGKNTGVGCHFLLQCIKEKSESEVTQSCPTLSDPMDYSPLGPPSLGFSRQEYWSGVPLPSPMLELIRHQSSSQLVLGILCALSSIKHQWGEQALKSKGPLHHLLVILVMPLQSLNSFLIAQ